MKSCFTSWLMVSLAGLSVCSAHPGINATAVTDSRGDGHEALYANDGVAMEKSAWISEEGEEGHWLELQFGKPQKIADVHLFSGGYSIRGSLITSGELQILEGEEWKKIAEFAGNRNEGLSIRLKAPVEVKSIRLWTAQKGVVAVRELAVYEEPSPLGEGLVFQDFTHHQVCVNQTVYNDGAPKRFTVPTAIRNGVAFSLHKDGGKKPVFSGEVKGGIGDFSAWKAGETGGTFSVRVEGGGLEAGESYPFGIGPRLVQRSLLQPMVDCMIDARSVVGTDPSAEGGAPWRHGSYYTHELASLAMLYLAFPEEIAKMHRQIDWPTERAKVLDELFKLEPRQGDREMLESARLYFKRFEAPAEEAPDVVKLMHWGLGMSLVKPMIFDSDGDGIGRQVHSQTVEQVAYILALKPRLEKWLPQSLFNAAERFVIEHWAKTGLFGMPQSWHPLNYRKLEEMPPHPWGPRMTPYKGREAPGHSILPNLLMYEVARRDGTGHASRYMKAALDQAEYVIRVIDWGDPRTTKGHRMSEHKTITGLVWLQRNYPKQAPAGLVAKLEKWADVAISRSDNMWDYRRYDSKDHWAIPMMNEPGNLGGFPACGLGVSWIVEDPAKKRRLREISYAALDCLFGRNPINSASPHQTDPGWGGMIEKGWPSGLNNDRGYHLEGVRGALTSAPSTAMFPFNPSGKPPFLSGGTASNAAMNVGLSFIEFDERGDAFLPEDCLKKEDE